MVRTMLQMVTLALFVYNVFFLVQRTAAWKLFIMRSHAKRITPGVMLKPNTWIGTVVNIDGKWWRDGEFFFKEQFTVLSTPTLAQVYQRNALVMVVLVRDAPHHVALYDTDISECTAITT